MGDWAVKKPVGTGVILASTVQIMTLLPFQASKDLTQVRRWLALGGLGLLCSCGSTKPEAAQTPPPGPPTVGMAERALLEMPFEDAAAISPQHAQVGSLFRVAADTVEILKTDAEGKPVKVRAKGHVFVEMALADRATGLCEEATVSLKEVFLSGKPMVKQGIRVAIPTSLSTSFWITEDRLKALGRCTIAKLEAPQQPVMLASASSDFFPTPEPVLPPMTQPWTPSGTSSLLPALPKSE